MPLLPARLPMGGTIGVITPSAEIAASPSEEPELELERGIDYLQQLGFEVKLGKHARKQGRFGAGTPEERAEDINAMFADPQVNAIIASHGGVFANSCLPYLNYSLIQENPKIVMGFSDMATLLLALHAKTGLVTMHGNMVMYYFGMQPLEYDRQQFLDRLVHGTVGPVPKHSEWYSFRGSGAVEGRLMGGNDWVLQWLIGTPYLPDFSDSILFMEVPGFQPDILHNRLTQFRQAGLFEGVRGILIGNTKEHPDIKAEHVFLEVLADLELPIVKTDDFGHRTPNAVLPIGLRARLNADSASLELLEPCVE